MKIIVTEAGEKYIVFTSHRGQGTGFICEQLFEPGNTYWVEFDFMEELNTRKNTAIGSNKGPGFYRDGDFTIVVGSVESISEDDEICLRVDASCIILVYKNDDLIKEGDLLEIRVRKDQFGIMSHSSY
ncbi:hypothetical protein [Chitinophaga varians]|uniref:hypothetical protein n=1 Tax=Chitinophaga varians TaxID=2202339 RepID=UPI00165F4A78|nr:hypothetical protein [Chitinophaga varians]MBC9914085.1 hypothetical protein [Chitinophaga varians]